MSEVKSLETKLVDMLMDMHGREASLLHWAIKRKPDVMHAMYELWKKDVDPAEAPKYVRDPESWEAVIYENWKTGMGKIKLIKMLREMNGLDLLSAKNQVEEWVLGWKTMKLVGVYSTEDVALKNSFKYVKVRRSRELMYPKVYGKTTLSDIERVSEMEEE